MRYGSTHTAYGRSGAGPCAVIRVAGLVLMCATLCRAAADWPVFRANHQRTGYIDAHLAPPTTAAAWACTLGGAVISSPAIAGGIVYVGCRDKKLYAIELATGTIKWSYTTGGWVDVSPLVHGDKVAFASRDGFVYILDREYGTLVARYRAGLQLSSPGLTGNGQLVMGMGPPFKRMSVMRFTSGSWDALDAQWLVPFAQTSYSSPAVWRNHIVIGANDGRIYAVDTTRQDTAWTRATGGTVYLSSPCIDTAAERVYFAPGGYEKSIYAINLGDGSVAWKNSGGLNGRLSKRRRGLPRLSAHTFARLRRMNPSQRMAVLQRDWPHETEAIALLGPRGLGKRRAGKSAAFFSYNEVKTSSVAMDKSNIYVVQKELGYPSPRYALIALNRRTGSRAWTPFSEQIGATGTGYCASPAVTREAVFFGWGGGRLYALATDNGSKLWEDTLKGDIVSSPAIGGDRLVVATLSGHVQCYVLTAASPRKAFERNTYSYPNPAPGRGSCGCSRIQVYVAKEAKVSITIYTMAEEPVARRRMDLDARETGVWDWELKSVANGLYFAYVKAEYTDGSMPHKKIMKIAVLK